jgi:hypothetical protein
MAGDWKSADEIRNDLESGEVDSRHLVADLWLRVQELEAEVKRLG